MDNEQLLVVDDDEALRELLRDYLSREGFRVATVANGEEMDRWLAEQQADLVILDLMLPGEDGLSLARRLRAGGNLPIIMLSARGEEVDRIIGLEVGADDYLPKPFNPRELLARIRSVMRRKDPAQAEAPTATPRQGFGPFELDLEQINRLIGQSLELARNLEAGELDQVDLADLIDGLVLDLRRGDAEVDWQAPGPCPCRVNVTAVQRVLTNLLENALRYGNGNPPRVELDCASAGVEIRVLDRGPGIPEGEQEAVFRPFYRLDASRNHTTGGSGLGLAIARQLADANGFAVELEPRSGGGIQARIRMPATPEHSA